MFSELQWVEHIIDSEKKAFIEEVGISIKKIKIGVLLYDARYFSVHHAGLKYAFIDESKIINSPKNKIESYFKIILRHLRWPICKGYTRRSYLRSGLRTIDIEGTPVRYLTSKDIGPQPNEIFQRDLERIRALLVQNSDTIFRFLENSDEFRLNPDKGPYFKVNKPDGGREVVLLSEIKEFLEEIKTGSQKHRGNLIALFFELEKILNLYPKIKTPWCACNLEWMGQFLGIVYVISPDVSKELVKQLARFTKNLSPQIFEAKNFDFTKAIFDTANIKEIEMDPLRGVPKLIITNIDKVFNIVFAVVYEIKENSCNPLGVRIIEKVRDIPYYKLKLIDHLSDTYFNQIKNIPQQTDFLLKEVSNEEDPYREQPDSEIYDFIRPKTMLVFTQFFGNKKFLYLLYFWEDKESLNKFERKIKLCLAKILDIVEVAVDKFTLSLKAAERDFYEDLIPSWAHMEKFPLWVIQGEIDKIRCYIEKNKKNEALNLAGKAWKHLREISNFVDAITQVRYFNPQMALQAAQVGGDTSLVGIIAQSLYTVFRKLIREGYDKPVHTWLYQKNISNYEEEARKIISQFIDKIENKETELVSINDFRTLQHNWNSLLEQVGFYLDLRYEINKNFTLGKNEIFTKILQLIFTGLISNCVKHAYPHGDRIYVRMKFYIQNESWKIGTYSGSQWINMLTENYTSKKEIIPREGINSLKIWVKKLKGKISYYVDEGKAIFELKIPNFWEKSHEQMAGSYYR